MFCRCLLPLILLAIHLCLPAPGRAAAPSLTPDMPPEVMSLRIQHLSGQDYQNLARRWRAYLDEHPRSAVAHVQLARALHYAGTGDEQERLDLIARAYELDPECPEALDAYASTQLHSGKSLVKDRDQAVRLARKAAELAPGWEFPQITLWSLAAAEGDREEADRRIATLVEQGAFPRPLLDFAHNMLISAGPDGILFTNGDNDTYPTLALQVAYGIRRDVRIVNLSLLNLPGYARMQLTGEGGPFSARELDRLQEDWRAGRKEHRTSLSSFLLDEICDRIGDRDRRRPVYLALTLSGDNRAACGRAVRLEGMLWRVLPEAAAGRSDDEVDLARTLALMRNDLRLDSATDFTFDWRTHSSLVDLMRNYPAAFFRLAVAAAKADDVEAMRCGFRMAFPILEFHHDRQTMQAMAASWREMDPDNPEIERWR